VSGNCGYIKNNRGSYENRNKDRAHGHRYSKSNLLGVAFRGEESISPIKLMGE
jgi:hypothetical protein